MAKKKSARKKATPKSARKKRTNKARSAKSRQRKPKLRLGILIIKNPKGHVPGYPVPGANIHSYDADGTSTAPYVTAHHYQLEDATGPLSVSFPASPAPLAGVGGPVSTQPDPLNYNKWSIPHGGAGLFMPSANRQYAHLLVVRHRSSGAPNASVLAIDTSYFTPDL